MTHPKDMNEHPGESRPDEAELMLVDLLYGELGDSEQEHALERVRERALDSELDGLKQLRAMLRELPEEEPPAAVSAKLLHAAAVHAPVPAARKHAADGDEKKGILAWLSSLIRPVAMYPGLAAATTLILVVGVAGTMYLSGRDQLAEPRVSSPGAAPPSATIAAPAQAPEEVLEEAWPANELEALPAEGKAEQAQTGTGAADRPDPRAGAVSGKLSEEQARTKPRPAEPNGATSELSRKRSASDYKSAEKSAETRDYKGAEPGGLPDGLPDGLIGQAAGGSSGRGAGASYGAKAPATRAPARSAVRAKDSSGVAAQAPAADMAGDMDDRYQAPAEEAPPQAEARRDESADKAPVSKPATQNSARVRSLHDEARSAAANGQCDVVRNVAGMIRKLDERYYQGTYLRDKALATCLGKSAR